MCYLFNFLCRWEEEIGAGHQQSVGLATILADNCGLICFALKRYSSQKFDRQNNVPKMCLGNPIQKFKAFFTNLQSISLQTMFPKMVAIKSLDLLDHLTSNLLCIYLFIFIDVFFPLKMLPPSCFSIYLFFLVDNFIPNIPFYPTPTFSWI